MPRTIPRTVSVTIDSIAAGGDGVGRANGLVVFVPRTAPGDVITATVTGRGHFARGTLSAIVQPSPVRVDPSCPHYTRDRCGGCQLQHMTYPAQIAAKRDVIADTMKRIGKRDVATPTIYPSAQEWRYRTKLTLAIRRTASGTWIAGLHAFDNPSRVFALADCPITDRRVVSAWREVMLASAYFPELREFRGSIRWTDDGPVLLVMGGTRWTAASNFFDAVPTLAALYWEPEGGSRRTLGDRRVALERGGDVTSGSAALRHPGASFAQVNPGVAGELRAYVRDRVMSYAPSTVVDAYSGNGDLAVELAERDVTVSAIELDPDASAWAAMRLTAPSRAVTGRVEHTLPELLPADVLVVNPPRAGLHETIPDIVQGNVASPPRAIVYVSCDPATLARDVARLSHYRINSMVAFDMFPQTAHVETVCELLLESA
jgi:23S rRNA (uracil1939-C5)-methyltransferase